MNLVKLCGVFQYGIIAARTDIRDDLFDRLCNRLILRGIEAQELCKDLLKIRLRRREPANANSSCHAALSRAARAKVSIKGLSICGRVFSAA